MSAAAVASAAIAATGVCKRFGRPDALRDVGFVAAIGELVAIIGPSSSPS